MGYYRFIVLIISFLIINPAYADNSEWFKSLKTPNQIGTLPAGISCCDQSDCKLRQIEYRENGIYAWIEEDNDWYILPQEARITDQEIIDKNPFLQAVVCYIPIRGVICWIMNTGG